VLDLAGNVYEWTSSGYSFDYNDSRANDARVDRGGSWGDDSPSGVRAANRFRYAPTVRSYYLGFRCSR
jgi:formylglycine-generating enzyme required for sulfatase activity